MNIQTIAEHSVDLDLLSGGICIDVGCRGFQFSEAMRDLGCKVWAFDIENFNLVPPGIEFLNYAIWHKDGQLLNFKETKDPQAKHIAESGTPICSHNLAWVYHLCCRGNVVDVLKLDIESSEYFILSDPNFQPIPKQISVEFHMHCHRKLHDQYYDACMENLLKHYEPVQHELTQEHGAGENYWDSLFVRRNLLNK